MLTPATATTLMHKLNRDQRSRLQAGYDAASARLDKVWQMRKRGYEGAYKALVTAANQPNASRESVRTSREYADYKGEVNAAAKAFTATFRSVATDLETDGRSKGATYAYNAIAAGDERPKRIDVSSIPRYTEDVAFALIVAAFAGALTSGLDDRWQQAERGGFSPSWAVKQMKSYTDNIPTAAALNSSRTAQLFGARRVTIGIYKGNGVDQWIWSASLDALVCGFCVSMHGSVHSVEEELISHHNCRCAPIPVTPSWGDLGFDDGTDFKVETGDSWFREQPYDVWERILGKAGAAAYKDGQFTLSDVAGTYSDPVFGTMGREKSLNEILGEQLATVYKRRIA